MSVITTRDWDPTASMAAVEDNNSTGQNVLETVGALLGVLKKRKNDAVKKTLQDKILNGEGNASMEYDPETGKAKYKLEQQKPDSLAAKIQRYITSQQFGVDPVTGQAIQDPKKPRFGYQGNNIWQQLLQEDPDLPADDPNNPGAGAPRPAAAAPPAAQPPAPRRGVSFVPQAAAAAIDPQIQILQDPSGGQPQMLSPQAHYNQLRASGYTKEEARKLAGV